VVGSPDRTLGPSFRHPEGTVIPTSLRTPLLPVLLATTLALTGSALADADAGPAPDRPWLLRTAVVIGGAGLLMTIDEPTRDWVLDHRTDGYETFADIARPWGEWPAYVPLGVGLTLGGWAVGDDAVRVAGERVAVSIAISAVAEGALKYTLSRRRPTSADGPRDFEFFGSHSSMPSGHTTVAFALAASLAGDIDRTWASAGLYGLATASSLARLVDDMHWLSDLWLGAAVGIFSAEFVTDRILAPHHERERGLAPELALSPAGVALSWRF